MRRPANVWIPVLLATVCTLVSGCKGSEREAGTTPIDDDTLGHIRGWAGASTHRGTVSGGSDMFLLTVRPGAPPPAQPAPSAERPCVRARGFLPGPAHDPRVFYLVDGSLHVQDTRSDAAGSIETLAGLPRSLVITDLLAVSRDPGEVALLVLARTDDDQQSASRPWLLSIGKKRIEKAVPTGDLPAYHSQDAFFARFQVPRCRDGDRRCVAAVPTSGRASIVVEEPRRGEPGVPVSGFDALAGAAVAGVKDVAWTEDGQALYLAVGCRAAAQ